jgi:hypothetical protein
MQCYRPYRVISGHTGHTGHFPRTALTRKRRRCVMTSTRPKRTLVTADPIPFMADVDELLGNRRVRLSPSSRPTQSQPYSLESPLLLGQHDTIDLSGDVSSASISSQIFAPPLDISLALSVPDTQHQSSSSSTTSDPISLTKPPTLASKFEFDAALLLKTPELTLNNNGESEVWRYYATLKTNKWSAYCLVCRFARRADTVIDRTGSSTSNMWSHLGFHKIKKSPATTDKKRARSSGEECDTDAYKKMKADDESRSVQSAVVTTKKRLSTSHQRKSWLLLFDAMIHNYWSMHSIEQEHFTKYVEWISNGQYTTPSRQLLKRFIIPKPEDHAFDTYAMATMLDPRTKYAESIPKTVHAKMRSVLEKNYGAAVAALQTQELSPITTTDTQSTIQSVFGAITAPAVIQATETEIARYLATERRPIDSCPLKWWQANGINFPILRELARKYLGIPASSASSERMWSIGSLLVTKTRNRLSTENICHMMFLKHNLRVMNLLGVSYSRDSVAKKVADDPSLEYVLVEENESQ